ncbi:hydroxymethylpyrimidine/phosphomethylpyrimidine kinase [Lachnotalea glycerini]|uniref:Hydroxymethylpyrimidine/phosphomethylpyrimidine kinase n=1 Tax=Lachnotalea glycerini TaxID=1763509 RepID=A0A318EYF0_9FIRM|nr:bifunctional hydroxymethylpyrimidine kinase/phosphomethylpyrimidine kinase [Lachnotalea glycerini]PXV96116.1 hydroxymethylpyrimidine/phosphomethylpyrimidine kinase [Lachnotalea glycerini]
MKKVLTIAGSDCSGGAGIQADIKTMSAHGIYAMSVITALTAQNTMGVYEIFKLPKEFVARQMDCIFTDISPDAVKIGMVLSADIIEAIVYKLKKYNAKNIVLDTVMVSTSNDMLIDGNSMKQFMEELMPLASLITPNVPEAEVLSGIEIKTSKDVIAAATLISKRYKGAILIKGGHLHGNAKDLLYRNGEIKWFESERINNPNTHGTGCTLSSAIACGLAKGYNIEQSVKEAKDYITGAIRAGLNLGKGNGPLNHCYEVSSGR